MEIQDLRSLIDLDFAMDKKDKDFKLNSYQIIKALKIMLHKVNILDRMYKSDLDATRAQFEKRFVKTEDIFKSSLDEMQSFLHALHG